MNSEFQSAFSWGIVGLYIISSVLLFYTAYRVIRIHFTVGLAFVSLLGFAVSTVYRNYAVFIAITMTFPPTVMMANYIGAVLFFIASALCARGLPKMAHGYKRWIN